MLKSLILEDVQAKEPEKKEYQNSRRKIRTVVTWKQRMEEHFQTVKRKHCMISKMASSSKISLFYSLENRYGVFHCMILF